MSTASPKRLLTHSEDFHTDDVFATAMLLELFPDAQVTRSRDEKVIATGDIVYDVGKVFDPAKGHFDHHQAQAGKRENGIIYSSFGLLWREYGLRFCDGDEALWGAIDKQLAVPVDANDNGQKVTAATFEDVEPFTIDSIIATMNPQLWVEPSEDYDEQFMKAVELAGQILRRLRMAVRNDLISQQYLLDLYGKADDKRIIVAEKMASVANILIRCPELLYVVSPRPSGSWGVLAVSTRPGDFTPRRAFPGSWRTQSPENLANLTGVPDAIFCHATGFYAAADSKPGAMALAWKSLED